MKIKEKNKLIPKLRFPEFKDSGAWNTDILGSLTEIKGRIGYRGYTRADIVEKGKGAITLSPTNFDENGKLNFENSTYISWEKYEESPEIMLEEGHTVLVKTASVGKCAYVENLPEKATINPQIVVLKPRKINPKFLAYSVFHTNVQNQIKKYIGAGAIPNMSQASIAKINILLPSPQEQQKIADFLSHLDELIEARKQKLEWLKQHKKGLMQNLFPQEGEKVPKLRFPEFKDSGEWVEKKLGNEEISGFVNDKIDSKKLTLDNYISTDNMLPDYSGITGATKLPTINRVTKFIQGDILISNIRPYLKKIWKSDRYGGASNDVLVFRSGSKVLSEFLEFILKNDAFINYVMQSAKGVKMPRGDKDAMMEYAIRIPSKKEQQKIASCLSSIDEIITAEAEKIEQLEKHKKGLMQNLFPQEINSITNYE